MHITITPDTRYCLEWTGNKIFGDYGKRFKTFEELKHWLLFDEGVVLTSYTNVDVGTLEGVRELVEQINAMGNLNELVFVEVE